MIFWIEENTEVSYNQLIEDVLRKESSFNLLGYNYFLFLIIDILNGSLIESTDDLINYIIDNKNQLIFTINTSGTTSTPKPVDIKMSNCIRHVKFNKKEEKRIWGMGYPVGSFASTQVFFQSIVNKETIVYLFGIDFKSSDEILTRFKISNLSCTPTFLSMLLIYLEKIYPSIKKITTGGEKMKESLIKSFKKVFVSAEYINIYASTETGSLLYSKSDFFSIPEKYKSKIKVEEGTLRVHKSLLNNINNDTQDWYDTNDIVEYIDETKFKFVSRSNGFLNSGGYRISPLEIEDNILSINGVIDVHVYGKSNSLLGTIICADVIGDSLNVKMIKKEMTKITDKHKLPQVIRIVKSFEHIYNGKKKLMI